MLFDFESDVVLDELHWRCQTLLSLSDNYFAHGKKSLKIQMFPSPYPGFYPALSHKNWAGYESFSFNVYNPSCETIELTLRIDDKKESFKYSDRYNKTFKISPGNNKLMIALDDLKTSISQRPMNLECINRFMVFISSPDKKHVLYLDYFRLNFVNRASKIP